MSSHPLDLAANDVLASFPVLTPHGPPQTVANSQGFSGARIWRVDTARHGFVCLRAWPARAGPEHVDFSHRLMSHASLVGLDFVPRLFFNGAKRTTSVRAGRLWEVQQWMPGEADFHRSPTTTRLCAACTALARLHACWGRADWATHGECPAVLRRLAIAKQWQQLVAGGWRPLDAARGNSPLRAAAERAASALPPWLEEASRSLRGIIGWWTLQPCLRDPWHDHYLFDGDRLTGLIDYGAAQDDHPAVDVARTLGSLVEDDNSAWQTGLSAYRAVRAFSLQDEALARLLDRTGVVLATARWLMRLFHAQETVVDLAALALRLERLVSRMEKWRMTG